MEFRILGPLEAISDGTPVDLRGVEARLLAVLLLNADRSVSMPRLIEGVWDGEPPATATRQAGNTISILRRKLGAHHLRRTTDGYQLNTDDCTIDAVRFTNMLRRARTTHDPGTATALYHEALSLWRGQALSELPSRIIDAGARQLNETRLTAIEERAELQLELGEEQAVITDLRQLLTEHPYRQRAAGQLMLALHRQQRTPEALEIYDQIRTGLSEDLGLDPSERLRQRHSAILRADPSPNTPVPTPAATPAPPTGPTPSQLPANPAGFAGRHAQLLLLNDAMTGPSRSSVVTGAAGTGKTALAVHWAHRVRDKFPDGQLFINLRGFDHGEPVSASEALGRFIRALNGSATSVPADPDEATALYRTIADGKRILVILDNARDAAQIRPLLPPGPDSFTIITSRNRLRGLTAVDHAIPVNLDPLADKESTDLLTSMIDPTRHGGPAGVARLAELCGHLPLALRIAAAQLASRPGIGVSDLVDELDGPRRLDTLSLDGDPEATVSTTLDLSFQALDPDATDLFLRLGLVPGEDYPLDLIATVDGDCEARTRLTLDKLEAVHLIEQHYPGRYRFHDLTRLYAAERARSATTQDTRATVLDRFIDWHHDRARVIDVPQQDDINALMALDAIDDHPRLWILANGLIMRAVNIGTDLVRVRTLIDRCLASARTHHDARGECRMTSLLAGLHWARGDMDAAVRTGHLSVELAEPLDEQARRSARRNLGTFLSVSGKLAEAAELIRVSMPSDIDEFGFDAYASPRIDLAGLYRQMGRFAQAHDLLAHLREVADDRSLEIKLKVGMGIAGVALDLGDHATAAAQLVPVTEIAARTGNVRHMYMAGQLSAKLLEASGDVEAAIREFRTALVHANRINRLGTEIYVLYKLVDLCTRNDKLDEARHHLREMLSPRFLDYNRPQIQSRIALARSIVHLAHNEFQAAVRYGSEAADIHERMSQPLHQVHALTVLAEANTGLGEHDTARDLRDKIRDIYTRLGLPEAERLRESLSD